MALANGTLYTKLSFLAVRFTFVAAGKLVKLAPEPENEVASTVPLNVVVVMPV